LAITGSLSVAAPATAQEPVRQVIKVLQWNMDGAKDNHGDGPPVDRLVEKIRELRPDVVTINEICHSQAVFLRDELIDAGLSMSWVFGRASNVFFNTCNGLFGADRWAGNAIFSVAPLSDHQEYWFSGTDVVDEREGNETRGFTCALANFARAVHVCAIHLTPSPEEVPQAQAASIEQKFHTEFSSRPTILAGDFNAAPSRFLGSLYAPYVTGQGQFHEVDMTTHDPDEIWDPSMGPRGRATHGEGKLDYIFANQAFFDRDEMPAQIIDPGECEGSDIGACSDHKMLYGEVTLIADDGGGGGGSPAGSPPNVFAGVNVTGAEGGAITLNGTATDRDGDPLSLTWSYRPDPEVAAGTTCAFSDPNAARTTFSCTEDGVFTVTLTASDGVHPAVFDNAVVYLNNAPPELTLTGPAAWAVFRAGSEVRLTAPFADAGANDTHTCAVTWDDGTSESYAAAADRRCDRGHVFSTPGMYTIKVKVTDDDGGADTAEVMVVVYDSDAGFITAGSSIDSPAGAWTAEPNTTGSGSFQFNPTYHDGDEGPAPSGGKVSFKLKGTGLEMHAAELQWLVVTPGGKAAAKGTATVSGQSGYGFVLYGSDDPDGVRLVVWPLSQGPVPGGVPTYDNQRTAGFDLDTFAPQGIATGSVQMHN